MARVKANHILRPASTEIPGGKVVIKKYGDRRLYDSNARRYVNLEDIALMIREGREVQVLDARTGQDLTRVILTQIIMDDTRDGQAALPLQLLRQLVVASDRTTHEFLSWYLDTAFELYTKAGTALRSGVSGARAAVSSPVDFVRHLLSAQPAEPERDSQEVEELRRRVRELEDRLARQERRQTGKTARS
jgi:polyhydroxyalkanoate synthesis repressor PhaR